MNKPREFWLKLEHGGDYIVWHSPVDKSSIHVIEYSEVERLREILSYLPKVPTQPYEKELAQENVRLRKQIMDLEFKLYENHDINCPYPDCKRPFGYQMERNPKAGLGFVITSKESLPPKYVELQKQLAECVEALMKIDNTAPAMYKYNAIEMEIITIARQTLAKIEGEK